VKINCRQRLTSAIKSDTALRLATNPCKVCSMGEYDQCLPWTLDVWMCGRSVHGLLWFIQAPVLTGKLCSLICGAKAEQAEGRPVKPSRNLHHSQGLVLPSFASLTRYYPKTSSQGSMLATAADREGELMLKNDTCGPEIRSRVGCLT
jgi:hypothetical protein